MTVTGTSNEVIRLTETEDVELDSDQPVSDAELVEDLRARYRPLPDDQLVDADPTGEDAFGV
jgi:hypothetical protein